MPVATLDALAAELQRVEAQLQSEPDAVAPLFARAQLLDRMGQNDAARDAYVELLKRDARHQDGLTALAGLLNKTGRRTAALTTLHQVTLAHPHRSAAHANYATLLAEAERLPEARQAYEQALHLDPKNRYAHRGLTIVLLRLGEEERAKEHAAKAGNAPDVWPYRGEGDPKRLVLLWSARGNNVTIEQFIDDRVFQKTTIAVELWNLNEPLPPHDVVFNGIGDADACIPALDLAGTILERGSTRVLNPPSRVRTTGRAANSAQLTTIPGVRMARTELWPRRRLDSPGAARVLERAGFEFPVLIRSPGFHAGANFEMIERPDQIPAMLRKVPGDPLFVLSFIDVRGADGKFRKYRVMMVEGKLYPLHLAVSARWKIHFFSADMSTSEAHREEDRAFLEDMPGVLGAETLRKLERIRDQMGLDYGGVDFALDGNGELVIFEANATMSVLAPPNDAMWSYRRPAVERVSEAVRAMLGRND